MATPASSHPAPKTAALGAAATAISARGRLRPRRGDVQDPPDGSVPPEEGADPTCASPRASTKICCVLYRAALNGTGR